MGWCREGWREGQASPWQESELEQTGVLDLLEALDFSEDLAAVHQHTPYRPSCTELQGHSV